MDPNEALKMIRDLALEARGVIDATPIGEYTEAHDVLDRMTNTFEGLDAWISRGGFLPDGWDAQDAGEEER